MKLYETKDIRNVGLVGHGSCGKTSLGEAMIFSSGASTRLGRVDEGNTNLDYEPEEVKRGGSIGSSFFSMEWKKTKINIVDTPGDGNFFSDTRDCLQAVDATVMVVSAADGVEVNTNRAWRLIQRLNLPCGIFINKMERERANFDQTLAEIKDSLTHSAVPLQIPIGKEHEYIGFVDLISGKAFSFEMDGSGSYKEIDVPANLADQLESARESLMEGVAETDEALLEKFCQAGELTLSELMQGLLNGVRSGQFVPVFCGSATKNVGVHHLMDFIATSFPNPADRGSITGHVPDGEEPVVRQCTGGDPFSALVFKTIVDPYTGKLTIFRIFSGGLSTEDGLYNSTRDSHERVGHIFQLLGKKTETIASAACGDIVAVAKLKEARTGDTFCVEKQPVVYEMMPRLTPVIGYTIVPRSQGDEDKLSSALQRLMEEDASLQMVRDEQFNELQMRGMGQVHIELVLEKMKRKFGVEADLRLPKVPYRETIKGTAQAQGRHKKQTGGRGQFGDAHVELSPLPRGGGFVFQDAIVGGVIPRQFIPAVEKGIIEQMDKGVVAGYPVVDLRAKLFFGSYHNVDSSEAAFKIAGSLAFKKAFADCKPVLLEPIMNMEILVPNECMGDVMGDINSRRGRVQGMDPQGKMTLIKAEVPMSEVLKYAPDLNSLTGGRATFSMETGRYEEVPALLAEKVIAASKVPDED